MHRKKLLGAAAIVAAVAGGGVAGAMIGTPGITAAQENESTTTVAPDNDSTTTAPDDGTTTAPATPGAPGDAPDGDARDCPPHGARPDLAVAAQALGISEDELKAALRDGKTIAEVASDRGCRRADGHRCAGRRCLREDR